MRSLSVRVTLMAALILAASLAISTVLAYELLFVSGRDHLDASLLREQNRFQLMVEQERAQIGQNDDRSAVRAAVDRYLRFDPGSETYFTMINIDGFLRTSEAGPDALTRLAAAGQLPVGVSGRLETVGTTQGDVRILTTQIALKDGNVGATFAVAGSLDQVRRQTFTSLRQLVLAGGISLLVGSVLLAVALRGTLAPLRAVASAARATDLDLLDLRVPEPGRGDELAVLAREFNRMLDRLAQAAEARRQFLAAVSHELRTPLTIARGHLEVLAHLDDTDAETVERTTEVVRDELGHMGRLVDDLMTLAHSEAEGFLQPRDVSIHDFFDDVRLRLTGLDVPNVSLHEPDAALTAHVDPDRLAQAVLNLVVNAHRHTPPGTAIDVSVRGEDEAIAIVVADNGPGIDPALRDRVFEPFVTSAHGRDADGIGHSAGLGLAVVATIVAAHHGTVELDSSGRGTRVELRIPTTESGATAPIRA